METTRVEGSLGARLRRWRTLRGKSQLATSLDAGVSARHLSFIETGRSNPSRKLILALADALEVPLRERNVLLEAGGFASVFRQTPLDAPAMSDVRGALVSLLRAGEPNPMFVVDRRYDVLMANDAMTKMITSFAGPYRSPNVVRLVLAKDGLKPALENFREVAGHLAHRARAELEASDARSEDDDAWLSELTKATETLRRDRGTNALGHEAASSVLLPVRLRRGDVRLEMFTTITTLGTPLDITLQELRIETMFPANAHARSVWTRLHP